MSNVFLPHCLYFCNRILAAAIIISSLVCHSFSGQITDALAAESSEASALNLGSEKTLVENTLARKLMTGSRVSSYPPYTYSGQSNKTVTPGTYSSLVVATPAASAPDFTIGSGTVTLTGEDGLLWNTSTSTQNASLDRVRISPTAASDANLVLLGGSAKGNIYLNPARQRGSYYAAKLLIGPGSGSPSEDVEITGRVDGTSRSYWLRNYPGYDSVIETQGANLIINGLIGSGESNLIGHLNVYNGNVTGKLSAEVPTDTADHNISTYIADIKSGNHIETEGGLFAFAINLPASTYIETMGEIDINDSIGDSNSTSGGGSMLAGSRLESTKDHILLVDGISKAAGLIKSGRSIIAHTFNGHPALETALGDINQGGEDPLSLEATTAGNANMGDVIIGAANTDTIKAARDIISGTFNYVAQNSETNALADRIYLDAAGNGDRYYPGSAITANTLSAGGRIAAGEIKLPRDEKAGELVAGNLLIIKTKARDVSDPPAGTTPTGQNLHNYDIPFSASTGNVTIENGAFTLNSPDNVSYLITPEGAAHKTESADFASLVEGNLTVSENGSSSFKTLKVGGQASISQGSLEGISLSAGSAIFSNLKLLNISQLLDVSTSLDVEENKASSVNITRVGGDASISGGSYTGLLFKAANAKFENMSGENALKLTGNIPDADSSISAGNNLQAETISIQLEENAHATVDKLNAISDAGASSLSISGGDFEGNIIESAGDATFSSFNNINIKESVTIGANLAIEDGGSSTFKSISIGGDGTVKGGTFSADTIETGVKNGLSGDLSLDNASFRFGSEGNVNGGIIHGKLASSNTGSGSFTNLTVDQDVKIDGGSISGTSLKAKNTNLSGLSSLEISESLDSREDIVIRMGEKGTANVANGNASGKFSIQGGSYAGNSLTAGTDANFSALNSLKVVNADIGGALSISANKDSVFNTLSVQGATKVEGGSFKADKLTSGASGGGGDFEISNGSFNLGSDSSEQSAIHGSFSAMGNVNSVFGKLVVDKMFTLSGGYLEGASLNAESGQFLDGAIAHIDNLTLSGKGISLNITEGSVVTVKTVTDPDGNEFFDKGGLYVLGSPDPGPDAEIMEIYLQEGSFIADKAVVQANFIEGFSENGQTRDVKAHRLLAKYIDIANANLQLSGLGEYGSVISQDLVIAENRDSRLADTKVEGQVNISDGTLTARKLTIGGNASFTGVNLNLSGLGANASSIGGELDIKANEQATLGDLTVTGKMSVDGGKLAVGILDANNNVSFSNLDAILGGTSANPGTIRGSLNLVDNGSINLGYMAIDGDLLSNGGSLEANSLKIGGNASLDSVNLHLLGTVDNPDEVKGNLSLKNNVATLLGAIKIGGNLETSGGSFEAASLGADGDASFENVKLSLAGTADNPGSIRGNLMLKENPGASLGILKLGKSLSVEGGSITAQQLEVGEDASFSGVELTLSGTESMPDIVRGNLSLNNYSNATLGHILVEGTSIMEGGKFQAHELSGGSLDFTNADSRVDSLKLSKEARFSGGTLIATDLYANKASLGDGLLAELKNLMLEGSGKSLNIGLGDHDRGGTTVQVEQLNLNTGQLNVLGSNYGQTILAAGSFSSNGGTGYNINGHIGIGMNGRLILGSSDTGWLPANLSSARATLALAQPMRLGSGLGIHLTGTGVPNPHANAVNFDSASLLVIDASSQRSYYMGKYIASALLNDSNGARGALSAESATKAMVNPDAQIYIRNPQPYTVVVALGENIQTTYIDSQSRARSAGNGGWTGSNLDYDNKDKVKIERLEGEYAGQFSVMPLDDPGQDPDGPVQPEEPPIVPGEPSDNMPDNPGNPDMPGGPDGPELPSQPVTPEMPVQPVSPTPSQSHPGADPGIHEVIGDESAKDNIGTKPHQLVSHNGSGFISHTLAHGKPHEATSLVEGALRIAVLGAVPQMALTAYSAAEEAMHQRVDLASLLIHDKDVYARSISLWAVPLYKSSAAWNMDAGSLDYDYHGAIGGLALGGDVSYEDISRFGFALNFGGAYSKSGGDLPETSNSMSFWGLGAYGGWHWGNLGLSADVNFTSTYNKLKQDVSLLNGWQDLKADAQAWILGAGLKLEYMLNTAFINIIPHAGIKYHFLHVDDYDVTHSGHVIVNGKSFDQNIWTFPLGLNFSRDFLLENGALLRPFLDLCVTPALGDIKVKSSARFTNTDREINLDTKMMDYFSWGGSVGMEAELGNFKAGLRYSVEAGVESVSNAIFGTLRYEF